MQLELWRHYGKFYDVTSATKFVVYRIPQDTTPVTTTVFLDEIFLTKHLLAAEQTESFLLFGVFV